MDKVNEFTHEALLRRLTQAERRGDEVVIVDHKCTSSRSRRGCARPSRG